MGVNRACTRSSPRKPPAVDTDAEGAKAVSTPRDTAEARHSRFAKQTPRASMNAESRDDVRVERVRPPGRARTRALPYARQAALHTGLNFTTILQETWKSCLKSSAEEASDPLLLSRSKKNRSIGSWRRGVLPLPRKTGRNGASWPSRKRRHGRK